jgi:23S rRNA pseudouridine2605 synthase
MAQTPDKTTRLNRFLADAGLGSRRGVEQLIREGRVEINGEVVLDLAAKVSESDHVKYDGKLLRRREALTLVLNKPVGYLCTRKDPQARKTVYELLPKTFQKLNYVGRLDSQSSGLLILTTSGELTEQLTHPRFHVEKEYAVKIDRPFDGNDTEKLLTGIHLAEGLARAESVRFETRRRMRLVLTQGYNRQIRRMLAKLGYRVERLERVRIGQLTMPVLSTGEYQILSPREIELASSR